MPKKYIITLKFKINDNYSVVNLSNMFNSFFATMQCFIHNGSISFTIEKDSDEEHL